MRARLGRPVRLSQAASALDFISARWPSLRSRPMPWKPRKRPTSSKRGRPDSDQPRSRRPFGVDDDIGEREAARKVEAEGRPLQVGFRLLSSTSSSSVEGTADQLAATSRPSRVASGCGEIGKAAVGIGFPEPAAAAVLEIGDQAGARSLHRPRPPAFPGSIGAEQEQWRRSRAGGRSRRRSPSRAAAGGEQSGGGDDRGRGGTSAAASSRRRPDPSGASCAAEFSPRTDLSSFDSLQ